MEILLFIFYLLLFSTFIFIVPFFKKSSLERKYLLVLFLIKVGTGVAYGRFFQQPAYINRADTWNFYKLSLDEKRWLLNDPLSFTKDLFTHGYTDSGNLFSGLNSYWNDLKTNLLVKIFALINVFTNNSYYTAVIFFNFIFLTGLVALYKFFDNIFPKKKWFIAGGIFLFPSTLFWCSGIHKDGFVLAALGWLFYFLYQFLEESKYSFKGITVVIVASLVVFAFRNYLLFAIFPASILWFSSEKWNEKKLLITTVVICGSLLFFFGFHYLVPSINFPSFIVAKRNEFLQLTGNSLVIAPNLNTSFTSFLNFFPFAIDMALFRPHISEVEGVVYLPAILEWIFFLCLLTFAVFKTHWKSMTPIVLSLFLFCLICLLIAGYTVPFSGAIVRYRAVIWPFLIVPLFGLLNINFKKIFPFQKKNRV